MRAGRGLASVDGAAVSGVARLWRHLQTWARDSDKARNVWLAYGDRDRLRRAMPLLEPLLRREQILVRPGGHAWTVWSPAMREVLTAASNDSRNRAPSQR